MNLDIVIEAFGLDRATLCAVFLCGSRVYFPQSVAVATKPKDWDFVIVSLGAPLTELDRCNRHIVPNIQAVAPDGVDMEAMHYTLETFVEYCRSGDYFTLAAAHTPDWARLLELEPSRLGLQSKEEVLDYLQPDWPTLRRATLHEINFSQKKALRLWKRGEVYAGKKNLISGIRFLQLGIQLAQKRRMTDFTLANNHLRDIMESPSQEWPQFEAQYFPIYQALLGDLLACMQVPRLALTREDLPLLCRAQSGVVLPVADLDYECLLFSPLTSSRSRFLQNCGGALFSTAASASASGASSPRALPIVPSFHTKEFNWASSSLQVFEAGLGDVWCCFYDETWRAVRLPVHPHTVASLFDPTLPPPQFNFSELSLDPLLSYTLVHSIDGLRLLGWRARSEPEARPVLLTGSEPAPWPWVVRRGDWEQGLAGPLPTEKALERALWEADPRRLRGVHLFDAAADCWETILSPAFLASQAFGVYGHWNLPWSSPHQVPKARALLTLLLAEHILGASLLPEDIDERTTLDRSETADRVTCPAARAYIDALLQYLREVTFDPKENPKHKWFALLRAAQAYPGREADVLRDSHQFNSFVLRFVAALKHG